MAEGYRRIEAGEKGPIHVWQPDGSPKGTVVYIHGYFDKKYNNGKYPDYWKKYSGAGQVPLGEQFRRSGVCALFVVPRAAESDKDPPTLYWKDLDALLAKVEAPAGPVVLVGHSGAYRHYLAWMTNPRVKHMTLLDSTYFGAGSFPKFKTFVEKGGTLDVVACTEPPTSNARSLVAELSRVAKVVKRTALPASSFDELTSEEKGATTLYIEKSYPHNELISHGKVIPYLLRRAPIGRLPEKNDTPNNPLPEEPKRDQPIVNPGGGASGSHGPEVFIPPDLLPRKKQAEMGDTSWKHCGYCCKILVASYLHKLKGHDVKATWSQSVDVGALMKGTGYKFDGYAIAAEVTDSGSVLKKSGAEDALRLVDTYLSMNPPLPVVVGVDHKAGTANQGFDIDHFVLIVGRKYKDGKVIYPIHDVGGGPGDAYFEIRDGVLFKQGKDYRKDPGGYVHQRRYIATAIARYNADGSPPPQVTPTVFPANTTPSGEDRPEPKPHPIPGKLVSSLKEDTYLGRMAVSRDVYLKKGAPQKETVKRLQRALNRVQSSGLAEDGDFGNKTEAAVKAFQSACIRSWKQMGAADKLAKFGVDGIVGPKTLFALDVALAEAEAIEVVHDGKGVEVILPDHVPCTFPPSADEVKLYDALSTAVLKVGRFETATWQMNLVGVRGFKNGKRVPNEPDEFNDTIAALYVCDKGHKHAPAFLASVDPGSCKDGEADVHLDNGQYVYKVGNYGGTPALVPKSKVWVWYDTGEDGFRHADDRVEEGNFNIAILPNEAGDVVSDFGGGLQVVHGGKAPGSPFMKLLSLAQRDPNGEFYYTLIDGAQVPGQDPTENPTRTDPPRKDPEPGKLPDPIPGTPPPIADQGEPVATEPPFAEPTGLYWPIITKLKKGREVAYKNVDGKIIGNAGRRFLATRSGGKRYHVGIDLWGDLGDPVVACEDGRIVNWYHFYEGVYALIVQNDSGTVINYGEVDKNSLTKLGLKVGDRVKAGQQIAFVGKMKVDSMCHFEMYTAGTKSNKRWMVGERRPPELLNPTKYLLALATAKPPEKPKEEPQDDIPPYVEPRCQACADLLALGARVSEKVRRGSADRDAVKDFQYHLVKFGYDLGKSGPNQDGVDGGYGAMSAEASAAFFAEIGVPDTNPDMLTENEVKLIVAHCEKGFRTKGPPKPPPYDGGETMPTGMLGCRLFAGIRGAELTEAESDFIVGLAGKSPSQDDKLKLMRLVYKTFLHLTGRPPTAAGMAAQFALESGYGVAQSGRFNYGGIKGPPNEKDSKLCVTWECGLTPAAVEAYKSRGHFISQETRSDGKVWYKVKDWFKNYSSLGEYLSKKVSLIRDGKVYKAKQVFESPSPEEYCKRIKDAGYATASNYTSSLINLLTVWDNYARDKKGKTVEIVKATANAPIDESVFAGGKLS